MTMRARVHGGWGIVIGAAAVVLVLGGAGCGSGGSENPPACIAGASGCACKVDGTCDGDLQCSDSLCVAPTCVAGTMGCPCRTGAACDNGLQCTADVCGAPAGTGLVVGHAAVRACDIVFDAPGATVAYASQVTGVTARRGDRVALSFAAKADAALDGPVAAVTGSDGTVLAGVAPQKAECFDRLGQAVADPVVTLR